MTQISAKVIAYSKSAISGKEIITMELEYPRFIHSEFMTHRMFSRNAASSRAIPVNKMIEQVRTDPAIPVYWGKNQAGMQAKEELEDWNKGLMQGFWEGASHHAARLAEDMSNVGAHKQIVNRILEPFQTMKTVVTATEWENFYWLRNHEDAQPEIKRLAEVMLEAISQNEPYTLKPGDWHVPYFGGEGVGYWLKGCGVPLEDALAISSSCCAQVSYRLLDDSIEKARMVYKRLVESSPVHASPFEHQATPMSNLFDKANEREPVMSAHGYWMWPKGVTHVDSKGNYWSGNMQGWVQYRQLIPNNVKRG